MVVDTDVLIRFLTNDDPSKAARFERFLKSGKKLTLTDVTFAEIYWTLKSFYSFPKNKILVALESLINTRSISCHREILRETIQTLKESSVSFIDAYTAAFSRVKSEGKILSFDRGFEKLAGITRVEP
ncbi:PIN domain-containing protein [Candidatus Parcubacteria bacterium]|nr:PIN domain-containing protein [Candidatus Parcubacteria bacterium]